MHPLSEHSPFQPSRVRQRPGLELVRGSEFLIVPLLPNLLPAAGAQREPGQVLRLLSNPLAAALIERDQLVNGKNGGVLHKKTAHRDPVKVAEHVSETFKTIMLKAVIAIG